LKRKQDMDSEEIRSICAERLGKWQERLVSEHSTPVLLLGVGHDSKKGQMVVVTLEDMSDNDLFLFVDGCRRELLDRIAHKKWR